MKKILLSLVGFALSGAAAASSGAMPYPFKEDTGNQVSVQRGARNFMNYCAGCHSMKHLRYGRMGKDLDIPDELLKANLMFTSDKPGDPIKAAMSADESAKWFGVMPPDLTVETRLRGADWVYNYLLTFYLDDKRPAGVNNLMLPGASMPHVLGDLQGWQVKHDEPQTAGEEGHGTAHGPSFELAVPGKLSPEDYRKFIADTVNFMAYAAEPGKAQRISIGIGSILFLIVFTALAYALKKEYWRDVH